MSLFASKIVKSLFLFFCIFLLANFNWLSNKDNSESGTISITSVISTNVTCVGDTDGTLTITATCASCTNGDSDIRYSINGGVLQMSNVFSNLSVGDYTVKVEDVNDGTCFAEEEVSVEYSDLVPLNFENTVELFASDADNENQYGYSVDILEDRVIIGAYEDNDNGSNSGSAYIYDWDGLNWVETKLLASDGLNGDRYGSSVGLSENRAVVGAYFGRNDNGNVIGSVYIYDWDGTAWVETELMASDGVSPNQYGHSVGISGDRIIVGAYLDDASGNNSGSAYIYEWNGATWVETKLLPFDGAVGDYYGRSVSISGDRAIVGAHRNDDNGSNSGSVYIYEWNGTTWVGTKLRASDASWNDNYGYSVGISGDRAVVGAYQDDDNGSNSGSVYIYEWNGASWVETKLLASDGNDNDEYGKQVNIENDELIIGAQKNQNVGSIGSVYVYRWNGSVWVESKVPAVSYNSVYGESVAISDGRGLVGAPGTSFFNGIEGNAHIIENVPIAPEIVLSGGNNPTTIILGDTTPNLLDGTDFGNTPICQAIEDTFYIDNIGTDILNFYNNPSITILNDISSNFEITKQVPSKIQPGSSAIFTISYNPQTLGIHTATISIQNDDCNEGNYTFDIAGNSTDGVIISDEPEDYLLCYGDPTTFDVTADFLSTSSIISNFTYQWQQVCLADSFINYPVSSAIPSYEVKNVIVDNGVIYAATNEGLATSEDNGLSWSITNTSDGLIGNDLKNVIVENGTVYVSATNGISISQDGGFNWDNYNHTNGLGHHTVQYFTVVGDDIYVIGDQYLSFSPNDGANWIVIDLSNEGFQDILNLYVNNNIIYLCTSTGLHYSYNIGSSWQSYNMDAGLPDNDVYDVQVNGSNIYLANDDYFTYSNDSGVSWKSVYRTNFGHFRAYSITVADGIIYIGHVSNRISYSTDNGANWSVYRYSEGIIGTTIDITVDDHTLYLASNRGVLIGTSDITDIIGATSDTYTFTPDDMDYGCQYRVLVTDDLGNLKVSEKARLIPDEITVNVHPQSQIICEGESITLFVSANSVSPLTYQWQKVYGNISQDIIGANNQTYTHTTTAADSGVEFRVVMTNATGCSATSNTAILSPDKPIITKQPENTVICENDSHYLSVVATSVVGGLTYQWQEVTNGIFSDIVGVTKYYYDISTLTAFDNNKEYRVVVSDANNCSVISDVVTVNITENLITITNQPIDILACENENITLSVGASPSSGNLTYQWQTLTSGFSFKKIDTTNGLSNDTLSHVFVEKEIIYITLEDQTIFASVDNGISWQNIPFENSTNSQLLTIAVQDGTIYIGTDNAGLFISSDNGITWDNITTVQGLGDNKVDDIIVEGDTIFISTDRYISISTDSGVTWTMWFFNVYNGASPSLSIYYANGVLYRTTYGGILKSIDNGITWSLLVNTQDIAAGTVYEMIIDDDNIYLANDNYFSYSSDGGNSWSSINNQPLGSYDIKYIATINGTVYIGNDEVSVIHYTSDLGQTWNYYSPLNGFSGIVNGLVNNNGKLYISTSDGLQILEPTATDINGATNSNYSFTTNPENFTTAFQVVIIDENGCSTTSDIINIREDRIVIADHPQNQILCEGNVATFSVVAMTDNTATYQWQEVVNGIGVDIVNETNDSYSFTTAVTDSGKEYQVVVTNASNCSEVSEIALLTLDTPTITNQPINITTCEGDEIIFEVEVNSLAGGFIYQWQEVNNNIATDLIGANSSVLSFTSTMADDDKQFQVIVTDSNSCSVTSDVATVSVNDVLLSINMQPTDQTACFGDPITFAANVINTSTNTTYQWQTSSNNTDFVNYDTENGLSNYDIFAVFVDNNVIYLGTYGGGIFISSDNGVSWTNYNTTNGLGANNVHSIHVHNGNIYVGTGDGLSISTDNGHSWENYSVSNGLYIDVITAIDVKGDNIYLGTTGGFAVSSDNGNSWDFITNNNFGNSSPFKVSEHQGVIYLCNNSGVYQSIDNGLSWSVFNTSFGRVYDIYIENENIYLANHNYFRYSTDGGSTWNSTYYSQFGYKRVYGIAVSDNGTIFLSHRSDRIYYTSDQGQTWNNYDSSNGLQTFTKDIFIDNGSLYVASDPILQILENSTKDIIGANATSYTFNSTKEDAGNSYQLVATDENGCTIVSNPAVFTSNSDLITIQPEDQILCLGSTATFTVQAVSVSTTTVYQWQEISNGVVTNVGTDANIYSFLPTVSDNGKQYRVIITNDLGCSNTSDIVNLNFDQPVINTQPNDLTVCDQDEATFNVEASSNVGQITYQWQEITNGVGTDILGEIDAIYVKSVTAADDGKQFQVILTDQNACTTVSNIVTLLVNPIQVNIDTQPTNQFICAGDFSMFLVEASTTGGNIHYQWEQLVTGDTFENWTIDNGLPSNKVYDLEIYENTIYAGTDSGLAISNDVGNTWTTLTTNNGLPNNQIYEVFVENGIIYVQTGYWFGISSDNGNTWTNYNRSNLGLSQHDIIDIVIEENDIFVSSWQGIIHSSNNGNTWEDIPEPEDFSIGQIYSINFEDGVLYFGTSNRLYISNDYGNTWSSHEFIPLLGIDPLIVEILIDGDNIYLPGYKNYVYSNDGGNTWNTIDFSNFNSEYIRHVAVLNDIVYLSTIAGELYYSADSGISWNTYDMIDGFDTSAIYDLYTDGVSLYIGTIDGVFIIQAVGEVLIGENNPTLGILNNHMNEDTYYQVVVSGDNGCAVTSNKVKFVEDILEINEQPSDQFICQGDFVTLNVSAVSESNILHYQWQKVTNGMGTDIVSETSSAYTFLPINDNEKYRVIITNGSNCSLISETITVNFESPNILIQPIDLSICIEDIATFRIEVSTNTEELNYQWQEVINGLGIDILSRNAPFYNNIPEVVDDGKQYRVIVTDSNGCQSTSNTVTLNVNIPLISIDTQPTDVMSCDNGDVEFTVDASTTGNNLTYQWQKICAGTFFENLKVFDDLSDSQYTDVYDVYVENDTIYAATNFGLRISRDGGETWIDYTTKEGLPNNKVYSVKVQNGLIYAGTNTGLSVSMNAGISWTNLNSISIDNLIVAGNNIYISNSLYLGISTDNGNSWSYYNNNIFDNGRTNNIYEYMGKIYLARDNGIYYSSNNGTTWDTFGTPPYLYPSDVQDIKIIGDTIYVAGNNRFYYSTDDGITWTNIHYSFFGSYSAQLIEIQDGTIYLSDADRNIVYTSDLGVSWDYYTPDDELSYGINRMFAVEDALYVAASDDLQVLRPQVENLPNSNTGTYTYAHRSGDEDCNFQVEIVDENGCSVVSDPFSIILQPSPSVTQPTNQVACLGDLITFDVEVVSPNIVTYQWQEIMNDVAADIPNATTSSYSFTTTTSDFGKQYQVVFSDGTCDFTSDKVTVIPSLQIETQPIGVHVCEGDAASFSVSGISASDQITYQWQEVSNGIVTNITDANLPTYAFTTSSIDDGKEFRVEISSENNTCILVSSRAQLTVSDFPIITTQPIDVTICMDDVDPEFSIVATGSNLLYQWQSVCETDFPLIALEGSVKDIYVDDNIIHVLGDCIHLSDNQGTIQITDIISGSTVIFTEQNNIYLAGLDVILVSRDNGLTWTSYTENIEGGYANAIDGEGQEIYVASRSGLSYSSNGGDSWSIVPPNWNTGITSSFLPYKEVDDVYYDGTTLILGHAKGISISSDNGATWNNIDQTGGLIADQTVRVHKEGNSIYVGSETEGLSISHDNGFTWTTFTLAEMQGNSLLIDMEINGGLIYVVHDEGIAISPDNGSTWSFISEEYFTDATSSNISGIEILNGAIYIYNRRSVYTYDNIVTNLMIDTPNLDFTNLTPSDTICDYQVIVTNDNGCSVSSDIVSLDIFAFAGEDQTICQGETAVLEASVAADAYEWMPSSDLSCTNCLNPTATPAVTTTYTLVGKRHDAFEDTFSQFVIPTNSQAQNWCQFRSLLDVNLNYESLTIRGSNDQTGITLSDPIEVANIATALQNGTAYNVTVGGDVWEVTIGCSNIFSACNPSGGVALSVNGTDCGCDSGANTYVVRPEIGSANWGGIGGATCSAATQTMEVFFEYTDPSCSDEVTITVDPNCFAPCPNNYSLTGAMATPEDYETDGTIQSSQIILSGINIDYDSGTCIELKPDFEVQLGAEFDAFIDGCNNGAGGNQVIGSDVELEK